MTSPDPTDTEVCFAGFRVARDVEWNAYFGEDLPERLVTASDCLGKLVPSAWCTSWPRMSAEERLQLIERTGFQTTGVEPMCAAVKALLDSGELLWPDYVQTVGGVGRVLDADAKLRAGTPRVLGIGLPASALEAAQGETSEHEDQDRSLLDHLAQRHPFPPGGVVLGYEPLAFYYGYPSCSWHCNALAKTFTERLGAKPNQHGLIQHFDFADAFCRVVTDEQLGEPGLWLPWLLVDYTAAASRYDGALSVT